MNGGRLGALESRHAMTVLGPVAVGDLGITLSHEHVVIDSSFLCTDPSTRGVSRDDLDWDAVRADPTAFAANWDLRDEEIAVAEVSYFASAGGRTLVEVTPETNGRDPDLLVRISRRTGVQIIMGCGYYLEVAHPSSMRNMTRKGMVDHLRAEVVSGVGTSGIRPGVLGEFGMSAPISDAEVQTLYAAGEVHLELGTPLSVHLSPRVGSREGLRVLDLLSEVGIVDYSRVVLCHLDVSIDSAIVKELLYRGATVGYDTFGHEGLLDPRGVGFASDRERVESLAELVEAGFADQIVVSQDVCLLTSWTQFGGFGYAHLLKRIVPLMEDYGISVRVRQMLFETNPARLFAYITDVA